MSSRNDRTHQFAPRGWFTCYDCLMVEWCNGQYHNSERDSSWENKHIWWWNKKKYRKNRNVKVKVREDEMRETREKFRFFLFFFIYRWWWTCDDLDMMKGGKDLKEGRKKTTKQNEENLGKVFLVCFWTFLNFPWISCLFCCLSLDLFCSQKCDLVENETKIIKTIKIWLFWRLFGENCMKIYKYY